MSSGRLADLARFGTVIPDRNILRSEYGQNPFGQFQTGLTPEER